MNNEQEVIDTPEVTREPDLPRLSVTHLVKMELRTEEMNILRDAIDFYLHRITDRHAGGSRDNPRAATLKWLRDVLNAR